jgi:Flp pilus assembly pilin Flp
MRAIKGLLRDEQGEDIVESLLIVAFVAIAATAVFLSAGGNVSTIWESSSATMSGAASAVNPTNSVNGDNGTGNDGHGDGRHGDGGHGDGGHGNN